MKITNGWAAINKQSDKINITVRIGPINLFSIQGDKSQKYLKVVVLSFSFIWGNTEEAEKQI